MKDKTFKNNHYSMFSKLYVQTKRGLSENYVYVVSVVSRLKLVTKLNWGNYVAISHKKYLCTDLFHKLVIKNENFK